MATKLTPTKLDTQRVIEAAITMICDASNALDAGDEREVALIAEELVEMFQLVRSDANRRLADRR
jgi:hypothetical protein